MNFCEKLQNLRKEKGMTQEELAEKLNISRQAVSKWESNQTMPETDKIIQIANLFDVSLDYLLKNEEEKENKDHLINNTTQLKKHNEIFITQIVIFIMGLVGVISFYIAYILLPVNSIAEKSIHSFEDFLNRYDIKMIFLICFLFSFLGLLLIFKNVFTKIYSAYKRQNQFIKYGIFLSFLGTVMVFVSLILSLNQVNVITSTFEKVDVITGKKAVEIISGTTPQQSFNPMILLILSFIVMATGLILVIMGIIQKVKNK